MPFFCSCYILHSTLFGWPTKLSSSKRKIPWRLIIFVNFIFFISIFMSSSVRVPIQSVFYWESHKEITWHVFQNRCRNSLFPGYNYLNTTLVFNTCIPLPIIYCFSTNGLCPAHICPAENLHPMIPKGPSMAAKPLFHLLLQLPEKAGEGNGISQSRKWNWHIWDSCNVITP